MIKVVSIGHFAGGSFGVMFNPSTTRELFTIIDTDQTRPAFPVPALTSDSRAALEAEVPAMQEAATARHLAREAEDKRQQQEWSRNYPAMQRANQAVRVLCERVGATPGDVAEVKPLNGQRDNGMTWGSIPAELASMHDSLLQFAWEVRLADGRVYQIGRDYRTHAPVYVVRPA